MEHLSLNFLGNLLFESTSRDKILYICTPDHPWMREDGASDKPLDITVLTRMKQFRAMNKLKKVALKVNNLLFYHYFSCTSIFS